MTSLFDQIRISRRFQRSIRIDADSGISALEGFICHGSGRATLETMARAIVDTGHGAFTWSGPYGGGKSSLASALCALVARSPKVRKAARSAVGDIEFRDEAFSGRKPGWVVAAITGRRADPVSDLVQNLKSAFSSQTTNLDWTELLSGNDKEDAFLKALRAIVEPPKNPRVLIVMDEMGQYLEHVAATNQGVYFFQQLAELANRMEGRLVVVGILHQAFERYAAKLGRDVRNEWAKVQGRFVDIPVVTPVDEVVDLLGRAIVTEVEYDENLVVAGKVADIVHKRRPGTAANIDMRLASCWPLHPVSAALLGPISRRRFGQNERSTFGFLNSSEPHGFQEFLRETRTDDGYVTYLPADLWDYLRANLEPTILASSDGHRWAQAVEAVERSAIRGSQLHIRIAKSIALIDLFHEGSGIVPDTSIVKVCIEGDSEASISEALSDLEASSVIVFRKHRNAWAIYAGSDFDIDEAVEESLEALPELNIERLVKLANLQPIVAKQHYHRTGTLRWFETDLCLIQEIGSAAASFAPSNGAAGKLLLALGDGDTSVEEAQRICLSASRRVDVYPVAIGYPRDSYEIRQLGTELVALENVRMTSPELEGDTVARREINARIADLSARLESLLQQVFLNASWYFRGKAIASRHLNTLSRFAVKLADDVYEKTPIIHSELINRHKPSSSAQAAARLLLYAMIGHEKEENLGIEGFSAERGLYSTVLEATGIHKPDKNGEFRFVAPNERATIDQERSLAPLWNAVSEKLDASSEPVSLSDIYEVWSKPPFGVRNGLLPILATAYALANKREIAVYAEGMFQAKFDDYVADLLFQSGDNIQFRKVSLNAEHRQLLHETALCVSKVIGTDLPREPLAVARALVKFVYDLPQWSQSTMSVSRKAAAVRRILLDASDPYQAVFHDLPKALKVKRSTSAGKAIEAVLIELRDVYVLMLQDLRDRTFKALGHFDGDEILRSRVDAVKGCGGDLRLEAFALRLGPARNDIREMEPLASLAINKPPQSWGDGDPNRAALALAEFALQFRQIEALAGVQGRSPTQQAMAIVIGAGDRGKTEMSEFQISTSEIPTVRRIRDSIISTLSDAGVDKRLQLAALAEAGLVTISDEPEQLDFVSDIAMNQ